MEKKEKEVAEEYLSSLADLNLNSKPLINMLTILAEENIEFALVIVKAVEQHIAKVNPDVKLPVLYLIDSIVKNVGREYIQLFSHSIVNIFCGVFDKVNEKIREKMYTLRQTWNDVFTPQKLYTLDVKVNCLDPNWPITAKVVPKSPAIHVNPNFLKNKAEPLNEMMEAKLRDKQRQLLELQKRKLELELAATKQRLEEQEKQLQTTIQTDTTKPAVTAAGPVPSNVPGKTNNTHYSKGQSKSSNAGNTTASFPPTNSNAPKIRVAPVNPALLNSIRQRDPRLARQQQQQQQQQAATVPAQQLNSSESRDSTVPPKSLEATTNQSPSTEVQHSDNKTVTDSNSEKSLPKIVPKSNYGNRDRSNRVGSSSYSGSSKRSQSRGNLEKIATSDEKKSSPTSSIQTSSNNRNKSSSSSSSRVTSSSKSGIARDGPKSSSRDKSSSSYDRKRSAKTDSPGKSEKLATLKQNEKSPKRYFDGSLKMPTSSRRNSDTVPSSPTKFKDITKQGIKARNYMRRNREKSRSTSPLPEVPSSSSQDVDLRGTTTYPSPKRSKQPETATMPVINNNAAIPPAVAAATTTTTFATSVSDTKQTTAVAPVASSNNMTEKLEQNLEAVSCMDVDLRQFHGNAICTSSSPSTAPEAVGAIIAKVPLDTSESKKRSITPTENIEEPASKKNKSEKIDTLFGTEDVDLRTLASSIAISSSGMPSTPPPPPIISNESENWAKVKGSKQSKMVSLKTKLDDVRAKLAKAAKGDKYEKDSKDIKKSSRFVETQEDSEDGTDTNIRTIISQAQEMLESENMDVEQYNTLVKTVIQINETNKLKEAQRRESLLTKDSTNLEDLTPISDEEEKFSSEDEDDVTGLKSSKLKVLAKRIPKVVKKTDDEATAEKKFEQSSVLKRSPTPTNGSSYADSRPPPQNTSKPEKRTRQKESKWSPWEPSAAASIGKPKWIVGNNNFRPTFPLKGGNVPNPPTLINRASIPSPWQNPPQMIFASAPTQTPLPPIPPSVINPMLPLEPTNTPAPPVPPILLSSHLSNSVDNPNSDLMRTINIDSVPKEIRFYDEVAIAFMEWDQPKEIGFQLGQRRILVDDHDVITLNFNDTYKTILIDGKPHQIRFGCPTRELYIDNNWYECYFGDPPIGIFIDARVRVFKVEGPAPQVRIGNMRQDLVVGKINLILDALIIIPVFLDAKVQKFEVDDTIHTLQFADYLKTVLIDNIPFDVEYGGLPKSLFLNGVKHFVRFGTLPNGVVPGKVIVQNMIRTEKFKAIELPLVSPEPKMQGTLSSQFDSQQAAVNTIVADVLASTVQNNDVKAEIKPDGVPAATVGNLNIDDLFQKLLASGILNQNQPVAKNDESKKDKTKEKPITPIDMSRQETIKARQAGIIQKLFCGMQCSSCGVRFPPEQTMKYSQHLDWHFRQNRKERDNSRRAHSRKWYYEVTDWIQYEEIEDLEEREKNWFESQLNEMENVDENSNQRTNSPPPSCPAGPDDVDKACHMCHDKFEQFYNEESEEWHLRGAIRVEEKLYHPPCYEDYKASLTFDETLPTSMDTDDNALDSAIIKTEKEVDDLTTEVIDDDEDDVIVVPAEEPSIQEIPDDDDDEIVIEDKSLDNEILVPDSETSDSMKKTDTALASEPMESDDVEIQEPLIPFTDLDTYEEVPANSISTVDDSSQSSQFNAVKIKEEPKDDGYNDDDAFEEVGTIICDDDVTTQPIDEITPHVVTAIGHDATQITSIDGNVDNQDTPAQTVGVNKIKINIINTSSLRNEHTFPITTIGGGGRNDHANSPSATEENSSHHNDTTANSAADNDEYTDSIQYTLKAELEKAKLKKVPRRTSGLETSGLCSIM